jgi:hypothetical protein
MKASRLSRAALDAVVQGVGGEGLEDVVVGGQLGSADDALVLALAGDHDEQRRQRDDGVVAQVFEQVLAVLAVADVVFAEDQVVAGVAQLAHRHAGRDGELDFGDAAHVEHVAELRPHAGLASTMRAEMVPRSITVGGAGARNRRNV